MSVRPDGRTITVLEEMRDAGELSYCEALHMELCPACESEVLPRGLPEDEGDDLWDEAQKGLEVMAANAALMKEVAELCPAPPVKMVTVYVAADDHHDEFEWSLFLDPREAQESLFQI